MLQDEIGSIIGYFYQQNPTKIYTDRMPQDFFVPSMYFPLPIVSSGGDTLYSYHNTYQMFIKFYAKHTPDALLTVGSIAESIKRKRFLLPVLLEDGTETNNKVQLHMGMEIKELSEGIAQLALKWNSCYPYDRKVYEKMGKLYLMVNLKRREDPYGKN